MKFEKPEIFIRIFKQENVVTGSGGTNVQMARQSLDGVDNITEAAYSTFKWTF